MFKDTDKTVFVGRKSDGSIYGLWTVKPQVTHEELLDDHPDVVAFRVTNSPPPPVVKDVAEKLVELLVRKNAITTEEANEVKDRGARREAMKALQ